MGWWGGVGWSRSLCSHSNSSWVELGWDNISGNQTSQILMNMNSFLSWFPRKKNMHGIFSSSFSKHASLLCEAGPAQHSLVLFLFQRTVLHIMLWKTNIISWANKEYNSHQIWLLLNNNQTNTKYGQAHTVTVSYNTSFQYFFGVKNINYTVSWSHSSRAVSISRLGY